MGAHDPAAAEAACGAVEVAFAKGEAGEDALGFGGDGVAVVLGKFGEGFVVFVGFVVASVFVFADNFPGVREQRGDGGGEVQHGFVGDGCAFLWEEPEGDAALHADASVVRRGLAEDEGKEGRFSRAVCSYEAEAVAAIDLE